MAKIFSVFVLPAGGAVELFPGEGSVMSLRNFSCHPETALKK